jgi:NADH dehydrogenase (ubiquinone) Fe-S protein 2
MMCMEHSWVLAIEQLLNLSVPLRGQYIRVMYRWVDAVAATQQRWGRELNSGQ